MNDNNLCTGIFGSLRCLSDSCSRDVGKLNTGNSYNIPVFLGKEAIGSSLNDKSFQVSDTDMVGDCDRFIAVDERSSYEFHRR